jgi:hypothetical protein
MALCGIFLTLLLAGCGGGEKAALTVGAEGFEPPVVEVPAEKSFDFEVSNDTQAVQTVTVAGQPALRVPPGETGSRRVELGAGDHRVTLEGAPFEATLRAGG